jgi:catechol 2,3-dioxygenase-like lactoylglutathione lyase family enzyme
MFSHIHVGVADLERAFGFYTPIAEALGWRLYVYELEEGWIAWQPADAERPLFIIGHPWNKAAPEPGNGPMIAFTAATRAQVDHCHAAALAAGGRDEGAPGLRPHYHPDYYGAYVRDLDGNKLCVVCHIPEV